MRKPIKLPTKEILNELFEEKEPGVLYWKVRPTNSVDIIKPAGTLSDGYTKIKIYGIRYLRHRLIWQMHYGNLLQEDLLDHIHGYEKGDSVSNLRIASKSQNGQNQAIQVGHSTGIKGIRVRNGKYIDARIKCSDGVTRSKRFNNIIAAEKWLKDLREKEHGTFARHNFVNIERWSKFNEKDGGELWEYCGMLL